MAGPAESERRSLIRRAVEQTAGPALSALAASWRRSMTLHGLDPDKADRPTFISEQRLREAREAMAPILRAAEAPLDRLFLAVGDAGCCVLLCDPDGIPVERRSQAADDPIFRRWGLWPGAVWSEAAEGTNAIGTALVERRPVTIHREQHFHTRNTGLSCVSHPIHDHLGRLCGVLDVSTARSEHAARPILALIAAAVADAARAIEAQAFRQAFPMARIVLAGDPGERSAASLLALDRDDMVIGATRAARLALCITDERLSGSLTASEVLGAAGVDADLLEAERGAVRRALALNGGKVAPAARALGISRATLHRKLHRLGLAASGE